MKIQILLDKQLIPIVYNSAIGIILDNKKGLRIIGSYYKDAFPLEIIKSIAVVEDDK